MTMYLLLEDWKKDCKMFENPRVLFSTTPSTSKLLLALLLATSLNADNLDEMMEGFDDESKIEVSQSSESDDFMDGFDDDEPSSKHSKSITDDLMDGFDDESTAPPKVSRSHAERGNKKESVFNDFTGKLSEQTAFSYNDTSPHDNISSLKSSLLLDYEHKFDNGFKFKTNAKAYYDAIYNIRGRDKYSKGELNQLESEVELFDAYFEGSLSENLDMKLGRQVVVWGRSDTIRITDVLNPLDNRRPGMVDIEDLRLPVAMAKFDYYVGDWRITPMAVLEQRFSKNPAGGSTYNPAPVVPAHKNYSDITPALSIGGEFSGWDVNFYATQLRDDVGYLKSGEFNHDKVTMFGTALNVLSGSWLLKTELAHFDGLKYTTAPNKEFKRTDALIGLEYNGFPDSLISYDVSLRKVHDYDARLINDPFEVQENTYQHAFRATKDFVNATVHANYLISLFGSKLNEGGFQRAWVKYDIADGIYTNVGVVDYMGGSRLFDQVHNSDMVFADITYSF